jgi:hypothetical protein
MKMRLQIASVLPAPARLEPSGPQGKGMFGVTLQEMLGTSGSASAGLSVMDQARPGRQAQIGTPLTKQKTDNPIDESVSEVGLASEAAQRGVMFPGTSQPKLTEEGELIGGRILPQPAAEDAPIAKELVTESAVEDPAVGQPMLPISTVHTAPRVTPAQNDPAIQQPIAGAMSHLSASSKDASQHAAHKAAAMHDGIHDAAGQSLSAVSTVPQPMDFVVPVTALQSAGPQPAPSKSASNAMSSGVRGQSALRRAPMQPMISNRAEQSGKSFAALGSQTRTQSANTLAGEGGETLHRTPSAKPDASAGPQSAPLTEEKINATPVAPATPSLQSKAAHSPAESAEGTASQMDARLPKAPQAEPETEVKMSAPGHVAPALPAVEHQASNLSQTILHETGKATATHRPEASVAQVLQRMDEATSSGAIQLRADARRLEVGVSSGFLGWVEVRATTGPSGRVDATLQAQNDVSAHVLAGQSSEISSYAREHSVQLGQVSVGVGTGESEQGESRSTHNGAQNGNATPAKEAMRPPSNPEQAYYAADAVSLISVRA